MNSLIREEPPTQLNNAQGQAVSTGVANAKDLNAKDLDETVWGRNFSQFDVFARNISMDYLALGVEMTIGVLMLPFNVAYLGQSAYGLWVLAASIPMYFSMLDLGYGVAQVKFAAQYRARRDREGLNQIVSTLFFLFTIIGIIAFAVGALIAFNIDHLFQITPEQSSTGRQVLLIISLYVALGFPFSVFGGVVNGFQRHFLNGFVSIGTSIVVAVVNIAVLMAGYGLVELVAATTAVRLLAYIGYRANAYRAFPGLSIRPAYVRLSRLGEVTGFSAFILLIDVANKLNYSTDAIVIGAFMSTAAIAVWAVAQRLITTTQGLTTQINASLFPIVVDIATHGEMARLRRVFLQGTRLSLAMVIPIAVALALLAQPLVLAWVGSDFSGSIPVIYILAAAVIIRVGNSTATTLLKGAGRHGLLAVANLLMALANLILSVALVGRYGLIGVALGTLIPLAVISILVLFPAACRRVELPLFETVSKGIWPSVWPIIPVALLLLFTRNLVGASLPAVAAQAVIAGSLYAIIFLRLAIGRDERDWYFSKIKQLVRRPRAAVAV
jgi:O-antigen/teichoic acid export membrane protein